MFDESRVCFGELVVLLLEFGSALLLAFPLHLVELHHAEFDVFDHRSSVEFSLFGGSLGTGDLGHCCW